MQDKKNILFIPSWYPSSTKPFLGNFIEKQAQLLAQEHSVFVINTEYSELKAGKVDKLTTGNLTVYSIYLKQKGKFFKFFNEKKVLDNIFKEIPKIDLILGAVLFQKGYQFVWAKKFYNVPLVLVEHSSIYNEANRHTWTLTHKLIAKKTKKHIDGAIAVSEQLKFDLSQFLKGIPIEIIGNHIDINQFPQKEKRVNTERTNFLHISTLAKESKNPELLFNSFVQLLNINPNFHLTVVCDENFDEWKFLCAQNHLSNKVSFIGATDHEEIVKYYHYSDYFILTSPRETFSIVLLEAWATGTPTISFEVGLNAPFQKELGVKITSNNPKELADQLDNLLLKKPSFDLNKMSSVANSYSGEEILKKWNAIISHYAK